MTREVLTKDLKPGDFSYPVDYRLKRNLSAMIIAVVPSDRGDCGHVVWLLFGDGSIGDFGYTEDEEITFKVLNR